MRFRVTPLRLRNRFSPGTSTGPPSSAPHVLDVWLPRFSNLAQVVLLALTVGSLFLTVLPLYQKTLLDEAIAKKEIELKAATAALETKYMQLRRFAVRDYIRFTVPGCVGMLRKIPESADERLPPDDTLTLDIKPCIVNAEPTMRALSELRNEDRLFFRAQLELVGDRLAKGQLSAKTSVANANRDVNDSNIEQLAAKRGFESRLRRIFAGVTSPKRLAEAKRHSAVAELEHERTDFYRKQVSDEMFGLLKLNWPVSKP